jgi:hypothetical protein
MLNNEEGRDEMFCFSDGPNNEQLSVAESFLQSKKESTRLTFFVKGLNYPIDVFVYEMKRDLTDGKSWIFHGRYALKNVIIIFHTLTRQGKIWKAV